MFKADNLKQGWEVSEFPIVCEVCLGPEESLRMTKARFGDECKVCTRPFTIFRWKPGKKARFKKTEICQTCAKLKNICQTCLLDLKYNLPAKVRDEVLGKREAEIPTLPTNQQFYFASMRARLEENPALPLIDYEAKETAESHSILAAIAEKRHGKRTDFYTRNLPHVCSFWAKKSGGCNRGEACPYRHEIDVHDEQLADQTIKKRFFGEEDPVADKILSKVKYEEYKPPLDVNIKTICLLLEYPSGVEGLESILRGFFYAFGEILSLHISQKTAFIEYVDRESAEAAIRACLVENKDRRLDLGEVSVQASWARSAHPETVSSAVFKYPSQDPMQLGTLRRK